MDLNITKKDILSLLKELRSITSSRGDTYFKDIKEEEDYLMVTCPFHKDHRESKPACGVFLKPYRGFKIGDFHCFACNESGDIFKLTSKALNISYNEAKEFLKKRFFNAFKVESFLPEIQLADDSDYNIIDEEILKKYSFYHPYMWERKLDKNIVDEFKVGYDPNTKALTFPVWDERGNLVLITKRSVRDKHFYIEKDKEKPVYLLNYLIKHNITTTLITEAQIDALTAWGYGFPCCATIGNPSREQINILNKSGIRNLICMFDNDDSGHKFTDFINKNISKDILVSNIFIRGNKKDINDLTREEFWGYLKEIGIEDN
jgi:DNA primase